MTPSDVGNWTQVTNEQAFDSGLAKFDGANTTAEWVSAAKASYAQLPANTLGSDVQFKGGASPELVRLTFYAPADEKNASRLTKLAVVATFKVPEAVDGHGALATAFTKHTTAYFHLPSGSKTLVLVSAGSNHAVALAGQYEVDASSTDPAFVKAYTSVVEPLSQP